MHAEHNSRPENGPYSNISPRKGFQRPGELNPQKRKAVSDFQKKTQETIAPQPHTCPVSQGV